jgi:hypothetical protein
VPNIPDPNPKVAPLLRREARVGRYTTRAKQDVFDAYRLLRNLSSLKTYINNDFRGGTLGNLAFDILDNARVQETQWGRTLKRFLETGLEKTS